MLSIRLESLAKHIKYNDKLIDIGCDHALLDIYLVKNNVVKRMIASDIHDQALKAGIANIERENLTNKIDVRLGDGLNVLTDDDEVNTILLSGMGTMTILKILDHPYLKKINKLVIQSNNDHYLLRQEICRRGFKIQAEDFLVDKAKHYINIVFVREDAKYSRLEMRYGPILIHNTNYLQFELHNCEKIYHLIPKMKLVYRIKLWSEIKLLKHLLKKGQ